MCVSASRSRARFIVSTLSARHGTQSNLTSSFLDLIVEAAFFDRALANVEGPNSCSRFTSTAQAADQDDGCRDVAQAKLGNSEIP